MNEAVKKTIKIISIVAVVLILIIIFAGVVSTANRTAQLNSFRTGSAVNYGTSQAGYAGSGVASPLIRSGMPSIAPQMMKQEVAVDSVANSFDLPTAGPVSIDKKIIKDGFINLAVKSADDASGKIGAIAQAHGGEVYASSFSQVTKNIKSGTITVKVPVREFETAFAEIKKVGTQVVSESTSGQDVTQEYTDLQAQLVNKQREEESIAKILEQSGKIEDVLAVTRELSRVRGEIERLQSQIRYMDSQTDMSVITISVSEDVAITPVAEGWRPFQVFKASVKQLVKNSQGFVDGLIQFLIIQLPVLVVILIVFWILFKLGRRIAEKIMTKIS